MNGLSRHCNCVTYDETGGDRIISHTPAKFELNNRSPRTRVEILYHKRTTKETTQPVLSECDFGVFKFSDFISWKIPQPVVYMCNVFCDILWHVTKNDRHIRLWSPPMWCVTYPVHPSLSGFISWQFTSRECIAHKFEFHSNDLECSQSF